MTFSNIMVHLDLEGPNDPCLRVALHLADTFEAKLIGIAAVELAHKKAAATANGFVGWIAYLGAATAGYPITKIAEKFGWYGFFVALGICGAISVALLLPLWKIKSNPKFTGEEQPAESKEAVQG